MPILDEALAEVIGEVIIITGSWLAKSAAAHRGRLGERDRAIFEWFDTYEFASDLQKAPVVPPGVGETDVAAWLTSYEVRAILQELIVVRLTDAPPTDLDQVRANLNFSCIDRFPDLEPAEATVLSESVFDAADRRMVDLVGRISKGSREFRRDVRENAVSGRCLALLQAIERHTSSQAERTAAECVAERDYLKRYRRVAAAEHGFLEPPDFEQRRRIAIHDLYVAPEIAEDPGPGENTGTKFGIWDFGRAVDRSVLLGDPGGGKSTAVYVLINEIAQDTAARVPLLVVLREYARADPPAQSVVDYIEERMRVHYQCPPPAGLVERLLLAGKAVVFFDGLDELVDSRRRREVTQRVENFCLQYPQTPVLITSRRIGYEQARLDPAQFGVFQLGAFSAGQSAEYAAKWYRQERRLGDQEPEAWSAAFIAESESIPDLRSNPLMLALLCILYRGEGSLPRNRPAVYERCSTLLFETWDASRSIHVDLRARDLIEPALRHLANWLFVRGDATPVVTEDELVSETARYLHGRRYEDNDEAMKAAREFVTFCKGRAWVFNEVGSTGDGQPLFTFSHRTFLEYFAAAYLASACDTPEQLADVLAPHILNAEWDVVAQLALQIKNRTTQDGAARFYEALLASHPREDDGRNRNVLSFAARCLDFLDLPPKLIRNLADKCLDYFLTDSSDNMIPIGWLMLCKDVGTRDAIASQISDGVRGILRAAPTKKNASVLYLIFSSDVCMYRCRSAASTELESEAYWDKSCDALAMEFKDLITSVAQTDRAVRISAYHREWVTVKDFGDTPSAALEEFFADNVPTGITGTSWTYSGAMSLARSLMGGMPKAREDPYSELEEIVDIIGQMGYPPWFSDYRTAGQLDISSVDGDLGDSSADEFPASRLKAWTGAGLVIAILFELGALPEEDVNTGRRFGYLGHLSALAPFLRQRVQDGVEISYVPLSFYGEFTNLLNDWALGKVNLVGSGGSLRIPSLRS